MSKRSYTLLEYLVALENKVKELKKYVGDNIATDFSEIVNQTNNLKEQIDNIANRVNKIEQNNAILTLRPVENDEIFVLDNKIYGNIVLSTSTLSFNENSSSSFTVKLDRQPTNNQVVNISVSNGNCNVDKSSITFSSDNYNIPQTITVSGVHSSGDYNNTSSVITISSNNVQTKTIEVVLLNIDVPNENIPVESITLNKNDSTLEIDKTEQLTVIFNPSNSTNRNVKWTSGDITKATVDNGLVTAKAEGDVIITATTVDGSKTATCSYRITAKSEAGIIQEGLIKSFKDLTATETFTNDSNYFTQPFTVIAKCKYIEGNSQTTLGGTTGGRQCYISWDGILNLTLWGKDSNNTQCYPNVRYEIPKDVYNVGSTVYIAICMNSDKTVLFYVNNVLIKSYETFKVLVTIDDVEEIIVGNNKKNVSWYYYNRALTNEELTQMYNYLGGI